MIKNRKIALIVGISLLVLASGIFIVNQQRIKPPPVSGPSTLDTEVTPRTQIEIMFPSVEVQMPGESSWVEATQGQDIPVGAKTRTNQNGRAQLVFPSKTVTRLDNNTEIELLEARFGSQHITVKLVIGRIWQRISKLLGSDFYQSQTDMVIASVRGTSYGHEVLTNGNNKLIASKKQVVGECLNQTDKGTVVQGTKAVFDCDAKTRLQIEKLTPTDLSDEWYVFNLREDQKLNERFGKETYDDEAVTIDRKTEVKLRIGGASPTLLPTPAPSTITPTPTPSSTPTPFEPTPTPTPSPTPAQTRWWIVTPAQTFPQIQ